MGVYEDYSLNSNRYGGASTIARYFVDFHEDFHVFAPGQCFNDISVKKGNLHNITSEQINDLLNFKPIKDIIPELVNFDIVLGCYVEKHLNFDEIKAKNVVWSVGINERIHPQNKILLLYNKEQNPICTTDTQIHYFQLGIRFPEYQKRDKRFQLFQCSRHCYEFGSVNTAQFCNKYKIKAYFAGPIVNGYPIKDYVDNINTFYIGEINSSAKKQLYQDSLIYITLFDWPVPFSLSFIEAAAYNCGIITTYQGFSREFIKEGTNGYFVSNEENLFNAINNCDKLNQEHIYLEACKYNDKNMINSLWNCFKEITKS